MFRKNDRSLESQMQLQKGKKPIYKRKWFILLLIIFAIFAYRKMDEGLKERFDWEEIALGERLPEPESSRGTIWANDIDHLSMEIKKTSMKDYKKYVEKCQSQGYQLEQKRDGNTYQAFDAEGYQLSLRLYEDEMNLELRAPMELDELKWPTSEIANLLPIPESKVGKISTDTADGCFIHVGKTSSEAYEAYVEECKAYGFDVDYQKGDTFYNAMDIDGNTLHLTYAGNETMTIEIMKAKEEEVEPEETEPEESKPQKTEPEETIEKEDVNLVDGMRPEFKKAMDSYETIMNKYCEFMKKYAKSDGTDLKMLEDYAKYMEEYLKAVEDFEAWDDGELNKKELAYYLEVQTRVSKKLLEVE